MNSLMAGIPFSALLDKVISAFGEPIVYMPDGTPAKE